MACGGRTRWPTGYTVEARDGWLLLTPEHERHLASPPCVSSVARRLRDPRQHQPELRPVGGAQGLQLMTDHLDAAHGRVRVDLVVLRVFERSEARRVGTVGR